MSYQFTISPPKPIDENLYEKRLMTDFRKLLEVDGDYEKSFQIFLEQNPCLVPGSKSEFTMCGSGHGPVYDALISQPRINGLELRYPDFLWLSYDSAVFSPVFIEIEAPNKKYFNKDKTPTRKFIKARDQLTEWQTILSKPNYIDQFYQDFCIPDDIQELHFEPYFVLIYGRRKEFISDPWKKAKRAHLMGGNPRHIVMTFDRLQPNYTHKSFICCKVKNRKYFATNLSPQFKIGPFADNLIQIENLLSAVECMLYTTPERKTFLAEKLPYCLDFLKQTESEEDEDVIQQDTLSINLEDLDFLLQTEE